MESKRQIKIGKQIQKDLATIFQANAQYYFGNALGTITQVNVSADLGYAKIGISIFPAEGAGHTLEHLQQLKSEIRLKLGNRIGRQVRIVPELFFYPDETEEKASKIEQLINNLKIPPEP